MITKLYVALGFLLIVGGLGGLWYINRPESQSSATPPQTQVTPSVPTERPAEYPSHEPQDPYFHFKAN